MILKGNQRGGGSQLAIHLMNSFDNEVVEVADVRGAVAQDLSGAFAEWAAEARATNCEKYIYSLSLSPDQAQGRLTREQYLDLIARTERSLKLVGQPRAVVFHEKRDKDGTLRQHAHVVWSRIDAEKSKAIPIGHDHLKLRTVAKEFARDYGLVLPDGMKKDGKRDRFNDRAKQENLGEKQQQERTGITKAARMAEIAACWTTSKTGPEFVRAMEDKGYYLARGDQRAYVVIDLYGEIHSLSRQLGGVAKKKELMDRLADYPPDKQPDVETARAAASRKLQERENALEKGQEAQEPSRQEAIGGRKADEGNLLKQRREDLQARQASRRAELDAHRADLYARQFRERGALREMQSAGKEGAAARTERQPKGLAAFLTRITGVGRLVSWVQNKADARREATQKKQTQNLLRHHDRELKEMDRHYLALHRLEVRENRSASTASLREGYRKLRVRTFALKPEFEKALKQQEPIRGEAEGGSKQAGYKKLFNRLAAGMGFSKGDLQAAFERATVGKTVPSGDADSKGHAPADPEKLEQARQLRGELNRHQPRPGPDRDRER